MEKLEKSKNSEKVNYQFFFDFAFEETQPTLDNNSRKCIKCGEVKPFESFPFFSTSDAGRKNSCKKCNAKNARIRNILRNENPKPNDNKCQLCNKETEQLVLDHCHETNKFRGWLCQNCNKGLGCFFDNTSYLNKAISYLKNNP